MRILAISGSLRARSTNTILLRAAAMLAPPGVDIVLYDGLGELPHFNPDLDGEGAIAPPAVADLRARVAAADAVMICSPEYAHGVPGSLKNGLDWLVASTALSDKPVALVNASPRSLFAQKQLAETLRTMAARVVPDASVDVPTSGKRLDEEGMIADASIAGPIRAAIAALVAAPPAAAES
jgi:NAD(P)H-dependent FMN reductase